MKWNTEPQTQVDPARVAARPRRSFEPARVAIVHYWFVSRRGGEKVVEAIAAMFPRADLFSLVVDPAAIPDSLRGRAIATSYLQKLPASHRYHRRLLPLYPFALEQFDLSGYDLVISSESGPAKGVLTSTRTCHICYCHSPMRYLWDFYHHYSASMGLVSRSFFNLASHYLRLWDAASAGRVDFFAANSRTVANRIRKVYRRAATVVYPPVNTDAGYLAQTVDDYYLVVSELVDYKRIDVAIAACNRLGRRLRIVGAGQQYGRLRKLAGPSIEFCGSLSDIDLREQYARCRALLFPGEEDFGIVPVEAMSFGRPVIAYGCGGAVETVKPFRPRAAHPENATGVFAGAQTTDAFTEAILEFEAVEHRFRPLFIRQQTNRFSQARFRENFGQFLSEKWQEFHDDRVDL